MSFVRPTVLAILSLSAFATLTSCVVDDHSGFVTERAPARPLIGGTVTSDDPAVVALVGSSSRSFCSGTLISPRVILTAAHCIDDLGADPNANIYFGSDTTGAGVRMEVALKKQHPMWTGELANQHDIGMLLLSFAVEDPTIAKKLNTSSPASSHVGDAYRHVGFGVYERGADSSSGTSDGQKREGMTTITGTQGDVIISGDSNLSVCFGDSGGPAFLSIDGEEVVAGVHSYTSGNCFAPNGDTDVQQYAEDFILPWVQENDPSCGLDGVCGKIGCLDDPDCQPCGPDGTCTEDCVLPDPDCQTQGLGDICRASTQCTTDTCVAYRDDPDYKFCTEACNPAADTCPDGMSCQLINPFGNICYYDDKPPGALGDSCEVPEECGSYQCEDGVCVVTCNLAIGRGCPEDFECDTRNGGESFHCFELPKEEGGCRIASSSPANALWLGLLGLLALGRRRRS